MAQKKASKRTSRKSRGPLRRSTKELAGQQKFAEKSVEEELEEQRKKPVECLGMKFENDDARREYFLGKLKEGLEELHEKLSVPVTTVDDAVATMKSVEHWPMAPARADGTLDEERLRKLAERMRQDRSDKDLLQRWKDEVGFPHGEIKDILNLSDPPYYTACPNPFIADFIKQHGKPYDPNVPYNRKPFAVDVSEGKTDPLYKAHSYHTKVPHLAIVPSILHYTEPGDLVLDGFAGSGMTGVAAQWCGCALKDYRKEIEERFRTDGLSKPAWGTRRVILNDLAPAATFIAANYNLPFDVRAFAKAGRQLLAEVDKELGWMYETLHTDGKTKGRIKYTVWSEVFTCPECSGGVIFLDEALDPETQRVRECFPCPHCGVELTKKRLDRCYETKRDPLLDATIHAPKRKPVIISYEVGKQRYEKKPDEFDLKTLDRIERLDFPENFPTDRMMHVPEDIERWGDKWRAGTAAFRHVHHVFLPRAAHCLTALWRKASSYQDTRIRNMLLFFVEQAIWGMSVLNRYGPLHFSQVNRYLAGVYYIASQVAEPSPRYNLEGKLKRLAKAFAGRYAHGGASITTTGTTDRLNMADASVDYVFTDPPFGDNLAYAELNFLVEAFHRVFSNSRREAIVSQFQQKGLPEYQRLMQDCFAEYCRVLKPGRWMTVVFHNSRNSVWNSIQEALQVAGFVVADVRVLDKQQGSFNQAIAVGSVKQDLVISAYKPNYGLEKRFSLEAGTEEGVWDFMRTHMKQLPVFVIKDGQVEVVAERQNFLLFDRMVAFHVQRGVTVPLSAAEFYAGLAQRFPERDGMYFLPEQAAEYDKKRMQVKDVVQLQLFVTDEASAIQWLRQQLKEKPQTFQEIHPQFMREIAGWEKHEKPLELLDLLKENFLCWDGKGDLPPQIHSYLSSNFHELRNLEKDDPKLKAKAKDRWYVCDPNKAADLEKMRERALMREFWEYLPAGYQPAKPESQEGYIPGLEPKPSPIPRGKRIKVIRLEAVRAGFKYCWQNRDYRTIIAVAQRIPEDVLQEDPKLLMYYDHAVTRTGSGQ